MTTRWCSGNLPEGVKSTPKELHQQIIDYITGQIIAFDVCVVENALI